MTTPSDGSNSLSLGDIVPAATFATAVLTAWLYIAGWTYAYYYFDRFRIPLLMLDLPKEHYFVYGGLIIWKQPVASAAIAVCVIAAAWACNRWSARLGRFGVGTLIVLGVVGLFAQGREGAIAAAQADFIAQRDSDYSAYPRLSLTLNKDGAEAIGSGLADITKSDCGRLVLFSNDRLFIVRPIRGASAAQLNTFVIPADQVAALRIRAEYASCY